MANTLEQDVDFGNKSGNDDKKFGNPPRVCANNDWQTTFWGCCSIIWSHKLQPIYHLALL